MKFQTTVATKKSKEQVDKKYQNSGSVIVYGREHSKSQHN